jgi:uncharacterized protein YdcH (DUF465 family)
MENHTQEEDLKAHLLATNEQFRTLAGQHAQLKQKIEEIESRPHVTPADELEEQRLKKLKLRLKDEMNQIVARTKHASVG